MQLFQVFQLGSEEVEAASLTKQYHGFAADILILPNASCSRVELGVRLDHFLKNAYTSQWFLVHHLATLHISFMLSLEVHLSQVRSSMEIHFQ